MGAAKLATTPTSGHFSARTGPFDTRAQVDVARAVRATVQRAATAAPLPRQPRKQTNGCDARMWKSIKRCT